MLKRSWIFIVLLLTTSSLLANRMDSLRIKLSQARSDSAKIEILYKALRSSKNSATLNDSLIQVIAGYAKTADCKASYFSYFSIAKYYIDKDKPQKAIEYLVSALKLADACKNNYGIMNVRFKLGYLNKVNNNIPLAKLNLHIARHYAEQLNVSSVLGDCFTILGNIYKNEMVLDSALDYHFKALKIREKDDDKRMLAQTYNNLGLVYKNKKEYKTALDYMYRSLQLKIKINDNTLSSSYSNLGVIFNKMKLYDSAIVAERKGVLEAIRTKRPESLLNCIDELAKAYDEKKDVVNALYYFKRLRIVSDSINKEEISNQFQEMQSKYESDKKDSDLKLQSESLKTAEALNSRKNILIVLSTLALLLAVIASVFIYRSYKQSKRNSIQLEFKNKVIEEKNKEITDSINYAKNIQTSLITSEKVFAANLKDHFILYKPKDIVSGDFYWAQKVNSEFIIVCADCTGHGVPGAFMSLMGIGYLKEIVNQKQITRPDLILNELRDKILEGFSLSNNKDGMDASLIKLSGLQLQMSAANNSIWIIRDNENMIVKPDKFPIGNYMGTIRPFTLNTIQLQENDLVIQFTDGYADQFGGPKNKKHNYKAIEQLVLNNRQLPLDKLKTILQDNLTQWQGTNEQVDDILVIGFRV